MYMSMGCSIWHTGLFNPSVTNRTPLISYIHGPILKPFGLLIVISDWFCFVYHEPWEVGNYPSKICHEVWTDFVTKSFPVENPTPNNKDLTPRYGLCWLKRFSWHSFWMKKLSKPSLTLGFWGGSSLDIRFETQYPGKIQMVQNQSKLHGMFQRGGFPYIMAHDTPY